MPDDRWPTGREVLLNDAGPVTSFLLSLLFQSNQVGRRVTSRFDSRLRRDRHLGDSAEEIRTYLATISTAGHESRLVIEK